MKKKGVILLCFLLGIGVCLVVYFITKNGVGFLRNGQSEKSIVFENPKSGFRRDEVPEFTLKTPLLNDQNVGKSATNAWTEKEGGMKVKLINKYSKAIVAATIQKQKSGKFKVIIANPKEAKYGLYSIQVEAVGEFIYDRNLSQDFSWGVLAVNTNKSIYLPHETAKLGYGVLDERGNTLCSADLTVTIADPNHNIQQFSTSDKSIVRNPKCFGNYYSLEEDYHSFYKTGKAGRYYLNLTAVTKNGTYTISDYFEVRDSVPFDVERTQFPSRIYPVESYPVKLTIKANEDYKGEVYDTVPIDFEITDISGGGSVSFQKKSRLTKEELAQAVKEAAQHLGDPGYQIKYKKEDLPTKVDKTPIKVQWNVDWKKGSTYVLSYSIYFPQVSPEYYLLGPFRIGSFTEIRQWQVASDATRCWTGSGADALWNTAGNWSGGVPAATSNATFHGGSCTTGTPDKSVTVNVDPTLTGVGGGITLSSDYAGTMTQGAAMTLTGSIGFVMAGGTFTGASQAINATLFNHTGGAFTSTSGIFTLNGSGSTFFINSGGSFTHNSGTVYWNATADSTITGSVTLYKLTIDQTAGVDINYTHTSGTVLTILNTLTIGPVSSPNLSIDLSGPGEIDAQGDVVLNGDTPTRWGGIAAGDGTGLLVINGTGNQNLQGTATVNQATELPNFNINKPSGTLTLSGTLLPTKDWTYTAGTVNPGTSLVYFAATLRGASPFTGTVTGSMTFYQLGFDTHADNGSTDTYTIASGTTLTVTNLLYLQNAVGPLASAIVNGPGAINVQGDLSTSTSGVTGTVPITFGGSKDQTLTLSCTSFPSGNVTINKSAGTINPATDLSFNSSGQTLTITAGVLNMATKNLTVNGLLTISGQLIQRTGSVTATSGVTVNSKGVWENNSSGAITLGGNLSNAGYIHLDGGGPLCGDADLILIRSSSGGTPRTWSGAGTFVLNDLDVQDQAGAMTAYSSTSRTGNAWTFNGGCPAYSNRSTTTINGNTTIKGKTTIVSN